MSIIVEKIQDVQKTSTAKTTGVQTQQQIFDYAIDAPTDNLITKALWSDTTKGLLLDSTEEIGIKKYSPTVLKDDNTAIAKAQNHLIDLIKYYEGDSNYYYEAFTTPYQDKYGSYTCGFGELTNKHMSQEKAYEQMCKKLETYSKEIKTLLNKRIGGKTYETLPSSIKEGLIDLCYNKGLSKISTNKTLMNAIKNKDYSVVVKNLAYVYSGKTGKEKVEDVGLYRRSLNRAILATRDLTGKELAQAKAEIDNLYSKAKKCHVKNGTSTIELDKIYEQFTKGEISSKPRSTAAYKFTVDETFKGKGLFAIARYLHQYIEDSDITVEELYKKLKQINNDSETVRIGDELKVPYIKGLKMDTISAKPRAQKEIKTNKPKKDATQVSKTKTKTLEKLEEKSFWDKLVDGTKNFFSAIGNFFSDMFSEKEEGKNELELSPIQKMMKNGAEVKKDGDLYIISQEYTINKGDSIWSLSRIYGTSEEKLCTDNKISDKNKIQIGQKIKIQKLGYKVQSGDTLYRIAKNFGLTVDIIKDANDIEDVNFIKEGQMIEIPGLMYKVGPNDDLERISKRAGVSIEDLKRINGLSSDKIHPGQVIKVVYNNGFYAVPEEERSVEVDKATNTVVETIDMSKVVGKDRKYIQKARIINGKVVATREVLQPTKSGKLSGKTIIVNAGHGYMQGGIDRGTVGRGGLESEWLLNYDNAMRLTKRLRAQGAKIIFVQGKETGSHLISDEIQKAENKADMFISIHVNAGEEGKEVKTDRMEIYYHRNYSDKLAKTFDTEMDKFTNTKEYSQLKPCGFQVLRFAGKKKMPALLWEVAFIDSKEGRKRLGSNETMNQYSDVLCKSIVKYFEDNKQQQKQQ